MSLSGVLYYAFPAHFSAEAEKYSSRRPVGTCEETGETLDHSFSQSTFTKQLLCSRNYARVLEIQLRAKDMDPGLPEPAV